MRFVEVKRKLQPNAKLRAWYAAHTFGGTTKKKPLHIAGFRKKTFFIVCGVVGAVLAAGAVSGGIFFKTKVDAARLSGIEDAEVGQDVTTSTTQTRTRTVVSGGQTMVTTETEAFQTTFQKGGGETSVVTQGPDGKETTVPASIAITKVSGKPHKITYVGSVASETNSQGMTEQTTLFGAPTVITSGGKPVTSTNFPDETVITSNGQTSTSFKSKTKKSSESSEAESSTSASSSGSSSVSSSSQGSSSSASSSSTSSSSSSESSSSSSSESSSSSAESSSSSAESSGGGGGDSGGGGGEEFEGEATFYTPGLGSCGTDATEKDFVAAMSKELFDASTVGGNANNNPYCGRKALIKAAGGKKFRRRHESAWGEYALGPVTSDLDTIGNWTSGLEEWERSRLQRASRRGEVMQSSIQESNSMKRVWIEPMKRIWAQKLLDPTRVVNSSGENVETTGTKPRMRPGITPAPDLRNAYVRRQAGGGGVTITVIDRCPVCKKYDLDLSPAAYDVIGDEDAGRIKISWHWLDGS